MRAHYAHVLVFVAVAAAASAQAPVGGTGWDENLDDPRTPRSQAWVFQITPLHSPSSVARMPSTFDGVVVDVVRSAFSVMEGGSRQPAPHELLSYRAQVRRVPALGLDDGVELRLRVAVVRHKPRCEPPRRERLHGVLPWPSLQLPAVAAAVRREDCF